MEDEAPVGIEMTKITSVKETVRTERSRRLRGVLEIALGDMPAQENKPGLAMRYRSLTDRVHDQQLGARQGTPIGCNFGLDRIVSHADGGIAVGFCQAVSRRRQRNAHLDQRHSFVFGISARIAFFKRG